MQLISIPGRPRVCPRPRLGRRGAYYPDGYKDWLEHIALSAAGMEMVCGDISVYAEITMPTRQRGDVDNYTKALLDGLQGYAYENDKQVVELYARMELDKENPGIRTAIAPFSMDSVLWAVTHG